MDNNNKDIDLFRLIRAIIKRWYLVIGSGVLIGGLAFLYTSLFVTPLYMATAKVYVSNKINYNNDQDEAMISDLTTSKALVPIYSTMVRTNMVLEKVAASDELLKAGINYTPTELQSMISTDQDEDTAVLSLNVVNPNRDHCSIIANAIATIGISEIANINDGSTGYVIDEAEKPKKPYYPSTFKNSLLGFLAGFVVMAVILIIREIFDTKIKDEEVLASLIGSPVLGRIGALSVPKTGGR